MQVSFFENNDFCTGINYSDREDCIGVAELSEMEVSELVSGKDFSLDLQEYIPDEEEEVPGEEIISEKPNTKPCTVTIFEGPKWEAKQAEIQKKEAERLAQEKEDRKLKIVSELGILKSRKDGLELLMQDTTEVEAQIEELKKEYAALIAE